jgi:hypothetical protein
MFRPSHYRAVCRVHHASVAHLTVTYTLIVAANKGDAKAFYGRNDLNEASTATRYGSAAVDGVP